MIGLSPRQIELFEAGCANPENGPAQELLNVFGTGAAVEVLECMPLAPLEILVDLVTHFWHAIDHEAHRALQLDNFVVAYEEEWLH